MKIYVHRNIFTWLVYSEVIHYSQKPETVWMSSTGIKFKTEIQTLETLGN